MKKCKARRFTIHDSKLLFIRCSETVTNSAHSVSYKNKCSTYDEKEKVVRSYDYRV